MIGFVKSVIQTMAVIFIIEVCGRAFLKHTFVGRTLARFISGCIKGIKWAAQGCERVLKIVYKEAKVLAGELYESAKEHLENRKEQLAKIEADKVIEINEYEKGVKTS